eukprot:gene2274-2718_t
MLYLIYHIAETVKEVQKDVAVSGGSDLNNHNGISTNAGTSEAVELYFNLCLIYNPGSRWAVPDDIVEHSVHINAEGVFERLNVEDGTKKIEATSAVANGNCNGTGGNVVQGISSGSSESVSVTVSVTGSLSDEGGSGGHGHGSQGDLAHQTQGTIPGETPTVPVQGASSDVGPVSVVPGGEVVGQDVSVLSKDEISVTGSEQIQIGCRADKEDGDTVRKGENTTTTVEKSETTAIVATASPTDKTVSESQATQTVADTPIDPN